MHADGYVIDSVPGCPYHHRTQRRQEGTSVINVELELDLSRSNAYFDEARRYSPGGAPDAKGWERDLFYIERAKGNRLWDLDGNEYIDYNAGAGPIILGHSYDELDDAVIESIRNVGVQVAQPHTLEVELTT